MNNGTTEAAHVTEDVTTEEQEVTTEKTEFGKQRLEAVPDRPASDMLIIWNMCQIQRDSRGIR